MKLLNVIFPFFFLMLTCINGYSQNIPVTNTLIPFATGFKSPLGIANAGDSRLFITEQAGYIRILNSKGILNANPFLDIRESIDANGGEKGLLGLAFHPQYKANGYFYVNYIGKGDSSHISRFSVNPANPDQADPQSELKLLAFRQPYSNHNGGDLHFGPDGFLYIGFGDGGSGGDPQNLAQNRGVYFGKMLRIDVDHGNPYAIPATNPFIDSTNYLMEIWALGLRNPWRFSFDRLTGDLWIADVGQNIVEEINFQPATSKGGENYGWRCYEGNLPYNTDGCAPGTKFTLPVFSYDHSTGCSVTGGYVYRGDVSSPYYGYYFFTDYCSDKIWTLHKEGENWIMGEFGQFQGNNFSTFGEDSKGQLYIAGITSGTIFRMFEENTTGTKKDDKLAGLLIIQIPASHKIRVENKRNSHSTMNISLFDTKGVLHFSNSTSNNNYEFDPGYLTSGIYLLKISIEGKNLVRKLIIAN